MVWNFPSITTNVNGTRTNNIPSWITWPKSIFIKTKAKVIKWKKKVCLPCPFRQRQGRTSAKIKTLHLLQHRWEHFNVNANQESRISPGNAVPETRTVMPTAPSPHRTSVPGRSPFSPFPPLYLGSPFSFKWSTTPSLRPSGMCVKFYTRPGGKYWSRLANVWACVWVYGVPAVPVIVIPPKRDGHFNPFISGVWAVQSVRGNRDEDPDLFWAAV